MAFLQVRLFGRLTIESNGTPLVGMEANKVQELLCYLLLHPERAHHREMLATLLWSEADSAQSRKYLRQSLWQLQVAVEAALGSDSPRLALVDADWVKLNPQAGCWTDVASFEQAYAQVEGMSGHQLRGPTAAAIEDALQHYRGELLEGWYQDWCIYERERLNEMYLALLEKLMDYCEANGGYEAGLGYGQRILRYDRARERTHRRLMRLHYLAGDRTGALRQYARCVSALAGELGVEPSRSTVQLYEQIRADRLAEPVGHGLPDADEAPAPLAALQAQAWTLHALRLGVDRPAVQQGGARRDGASHAWETYAGPARLVADLLAELRQVRAALADIERRLQAMLPAQSA